MNRRGFLSSILAVGAAPAIVRAQSLMPVIALPTPGEVAAVVSGNRLVTYEEIVRIAMQSLAQKIDLIGMNELRGFNDYDVTRDVQ